MIETPLAAEPIPTPEHLSLSPNSALQMRLYMGGDAVVYPPKELKTVTAESANVHHEKNRADTFNKLGITATSEGHQEWSQGEKARMNHSTKVTAWAQEVDALFKSDVVKQYQDAFRSLTVGGINLSSINQETAVKLYDRYFTKTEEAKAVTFGETTTYIPANVKRFVDDMIASHTENGSVNYSRLESHLSSLTFLAGMFGKNTATLLKEYLAAYIKFNKNQGSQTEFINNVNSKAHIDNLNPEEDRLLKWFHETSTQTKVVKIEQKQQASVRPDDQLSTASIDQGLAQQAEPIVIEPEEPKKAKTETPWDNIPKPDQPIKIKEKQDIFIKDGKGVIHQRETWLVLGTKDHPLISEVVQDDGSRIKQRETNPERPYQIPIGFYFDSDVTVEQRQVIQNSLPSIFAELGTPQNFVFNGEISIDQTMKNALQLSKRKNRGQIDTSVIHDIVRLSKQAEKPHNVVVITNKDMYFGENNFVIGAAHSDEGTIISLARIWNSIKDAQLRNQVIATEIAHEVGHVYDLPSNRRGAENIEQSLGGHCKSLGCCMKQGLSVPEDWITITQNRLTHLKGHFFCKECYQDLQEKFKSK